MHAPQGGYFTVADATALGGQDAAAFCRGLPERVGVVAIPLTAFVSEEHSERIRGPGALRACKRVEGPRRAATRLARFSA